MPAKFFRVMAATACSMGFVLAWALCFASDAELVEVDHPDATATHWSFQTIDGGAMPSADSVQQAARVLDELIQKRIDQAGLTNNPPAGRHAQARRLHLDLTGLPPTPQQLADFLDDSSPGAYENLIDRLLGSKHFGQHLGRYWLDRVRYADTHGLHLDNYRQIWPYRDWVIDAINRNLPYDQFATKQIAGDLLPDATPQDLIASGFNRLNVTTNESGSIYEEVFARNCVDRTNAFGSVFLGLTLECAACHDHKYDPISQEDYYSLLAYFNSLDGPALDQDVKDPPPIIRLPTAEQQALLDEYDFAIEDIRGEKAAAIPSVDRAQHIWEQAFTNEPVAQAIRLRPTPGNHQITAPLPPGVVWRAIRIQAKQDITPDLLSKVSVEIAEAEYGNQWNQVPVARTQRDDDGVWLITPSLYGEGTGNRFRLNWDPAMGDAAVSLHPSEPPIPSQLLIEIGDIHAVGPLEIESSSSGYDRSFASQGEAFNPQQSFRYLDQPYRWQLRRDWKPIETIKVPSVADRPSVTMVHVGIESPSEQSIDLLIGTDAGYVLYLDGNEIHRISRPVQPLPRFRRHNLRLRTGHNDFYIKLVSHHGSSELTYAFQSPLIRTPDHIAAMVRIPRSQRSKNQRDAIQDYFRNVHCDHPDLQVLCDLESGMLRSHQKLLDSCATSLIWKETDPPRPAFVLQQGRYDRRGDLVLRKTPRFLPPLSSEAPANRLGLAAWLTHPRHPLTARVAVNHFWQVIFGAGLVQTAEDFGTQGSSPSHPELLDFLALDFVQHGWDVKRLMKTMVLSDAYRRHAKVTQPMQTIDPENRLLARSSRYRLDAEVLRDQALMLSGQLKDQLGGPSVKMPQPDGLWESVGYSDSNTAKFEADQGDQVFRRSVYMFWKRTSAPPQMTILDAPSRETCTARRDRTNTPMQALLLMNEVQQVQAARQLAMPYANKTDSKQQLSRLFQQVTTRKPSEEELTAIDQLLIDLIDHYRANLDESVSLVGRADANWAAWTVVANMCLNLDEVINK
jgi:hypothetical protein